MAPYYGPFWAHTVDDECDYGIQSVDVLNNLVHCYNNDISSFALSLFIDNYYNDMYILG